MNKLILSRGKLTLGFFLLAALLGLEHLTAHIIKHNTKVGEFTCVPVELTRSAWGLCYRMDCEGKEGWLYNDEAIAELANAKKPIRAVLYRSGWLEPIKEKKE